MVKKKNLPTRVFKMKEEQDIRERSRKVLSVALFLKEIGYQVRNYCSLSSDISKILELEADPDKGLLELKKLDDEEMEKLKGYLEKRGIEILETIPYKFDDGLEVIRLIIKISSISL